MINRPNVLYSALAMWQASLVAISQEGISTPIANRKSDSGVRFVKGCSVRISS